MSAAAVASTRTLAVVADDVKIAHSVFAMPFAILAAFMAAAPPGAPPGADGIDWARFAGQLALIVLAMVFARTTAMLSNRLLDARLDGANPRTAGRALPSGRLSKRAVAAVLGASALLFVAVCGTFGLAYGNWWPIALALPVLAWIGSYPLAKRFTALCHLWLGSALALSPIAAALAVEPVALREQPALWLVAAMVLGWVAGFDVIYALQDVEVDRRDGLFSLPGRLGERRALVVSRMLHGMAALALVAAIVIDARLGVIFAAAVAMVIGLLVWEHATVARWGTNRIGLAFFTLNGAVSCVLGAMGVADVLLAS